MTKDTLRERRAMTARSLMNAGMTAREAARELGYTSVNAMLGAVAMLGDAQEGAAVQTESRGEAKELRCLSGNESLGTVDETGYAQAAGAVESERRESRHAGGEPGVQAQRRGTTVQVGHIQLNYADRTNSVRLNVYGNQHYLWLAGSEGDGLSSLMQELSCAAGAMAKLLSGNGGDGRNEPV